MDLLLWGVLLVACKLKQFLCCNIADPERRVGGLGSGGVTNASPSGWRDIFWMQAAFHMATFLGLLFFYHPARRSDYGKLSLKDVVWACDPIGSILFIIATTMLLLALDWAGGAYSWSDAHVAAPLGIGFAFLVLFCGYGESDLQCYLIFLCQS